MNKNIIIDNEFVKTFVSLDTTEKTCKSKKQELRANRPYGTYIYQGVEKITSCVTISPVTKKTVKAGCEKEYENIQAQIKALQEKADALSEPTFSHDMAKVTKAPKTLNNN